jgi:hypothetical protein
MIMARPSLSHGRHASGCLQLGRSRSGPGVRPSVAGLQSLAETPRQHWRAAHQHHRPAVARGNAPRPRPGADKFKFSVFLQHHAAI